MILADALVTTLAEWGVGNVFGVSGANIEHLHDSIHRLGGDRLRSVLARTEMGAAFMADARARLHGGLGVCCSTSGGGMMNLAVGVAESYNESVPVLAIVGQPPQRLEGRGAFQDSSGLGRSVNGLAIWSAITKYTARIESPEDFWPALQNAGRLAREGRPGPVALLIPRNLFEAEVGECPEAMAGGGADAPILAPTPDAVTELDRRLRNARKPVIVLGSGVRRSKRTESILRYVRRAGVPVATTMADIAVFPQDDPLFLGVVGLAGHPSAHQYLNEEADLIVAVGTGLDIMTRGPVEAGLRRADLAVVDLDADRVREALDVELSIRAEAGAVFSGLWDRLHRKPFRHGPPKSYQRTRFVPTLGPGETREGEAASSMMQSDALAILQQYLPHEGHLVFDAGNCAASALHHLSIPPGTSTTIALGMGGMGYAIPAAVGAQLDSAAQTRTMVICGDGAFLMLGLEVHTAVQLGLPILFVVFNNAGHGMCATRQQLLFEGREEASSYGEIDLSRVARGLGAPDRLWVRRAATTPQLALALADYHSLGTPRPGVLELVLPIEEMPPFAPFLDKDAPVCAVGERTHTRRTATG